VELLDVAKALLDKIKSESRHPIEENAPLLSLQLDEAHAIAKTLTDPSRRPWSKFTSFRRCMRRLRTLPVWSIVLSTTGKFFPAAHLDDSGRMFSGILVNVTPFSSVGFDQLAEKVRANGTTTLEEVTSLPYRLSLGRPL
jgi:hypothetical protein